MKIREHYWINDRCLFCGATALATLREQAAREGRAVPSDADERQCIEREDHVGALAPKPARRQYAIDDYDTISARLAELAEERKKRLSVEPEPQMDIGDCCG